MKTKLNRKFLSLVLLLLGFQVSSQTYFPPKSFTADWDTLSMAESGFCQERIDSLYDYLDRKNTKSFIILIDGKIALEQYFDSYTIDSIWYYASAGKSVMSYLLGYAQQEGYLEIDSPSSTYLGSYWTSCTPQQERAITVRHQMAMSTGLDDQIKPGLKYPDPFNCLDSGCLKYKTDPYDRWFYFNGPYRLTQDVLENATGLSKNIYSLYALSPIGWWGIWYNYVLFGRARDMARFGHLILNEGIWNGDTLLRDVAFYNEMINSSQNLNPAYGLLWWLNGKDGYILPGTAIQFNGSLVPEAPADMFAAMGKDDQRIYVIPSLKMVIVRQGEASGLSLYAKSGFDDELWQYINELNCTVSIDHPNAPSFKLYPNPSREILSVEMKGFTRLSMYDCRGRQVLQSGSQEVSIAHLPDGVYWVRLESMDGLAFEKIVVLH